MISQYQHGFLTGKSTLTNLLACLNYWVTALDEGDYVDVLFVDISKAFDTVNHRKLLHKIKNYKIDPILCKWVSSFLIGRRQRVKIDGSFSDWTDVTSGVPQGSVLGPLLFLLYINDLPSVIKFSKIQIYADDTKIYLRFPRDTDPTTMQADINEIMLWFERWDLKVATEKSFILPLRLTGDRPVFPYKMNDTLIPVATDSVRDLGVQMTTDLSKADHIKIIRSKSNSKIGLIFRSFKTRNIDFLKKMFCVFVRPLVEYATPAWNPHLISDILAVESVQRAFTRRIPRLEDASYPLRLEILGLDSLEERRLKADLTEIFKIVTNRSGLFFEDFFTYRNDFGLRTENSLQLDIKFARTNLGKFNFFNKGADVWNKLPDYVVNSPSVERFKTNISETNMTNHLTCFPMYYV